MIPGKNGIFSNNVYHGNHPSTEPADPKFVNPGSGKRGIESLSGYYLKKNSSAGQAGAVIDHHGGQDIFGKKVSDSVPSNIGAVN